MRRLGPALLALALTCTPVLAAAATARPAGEPAAGRHGHHRWVEQERDTTSTENLRGLDAVSRRTAWVSGDDGTVRRTTDGGRTWVDVSPDVADAGGPLAYRDVEVLGHGRAVVLAIGTGDESRIYRTDDNGATWRASFVNDDPDAFYDCLDFFGDGRRGLALSDPVDGRFRVLATRDGGRHWRVRSPAGMPAAVEGEFAFAASGTCLVTSGRRDAWIASGGTASRIFHSRDGGRRWRVSDSPIPAAAAGGTFSVAVRGIRRGVAVGGDYTQPDVAAASARSRDGDTWHPGGDTAAYRSGVDWLPGARRTLLAVGTSGADLSRDAGRSWRPLRARGYDAVDCVPGGVCWVSGEAGRVGRLVRR